MNKLDYCVLILTHNRVGKVFTHETIRKLKYDGDIFLVVDDEDPAVEEYKKLYKDKVVVFSKKDMEGKFDIGDNSGNRKAVVFARNACFDIAKNLGYKYFFMLDDDYTDFRWSFDDNKKYVTNKYIKDIKAVFDIMLKFYKNTNVVSMCMAQGGDFIGGEGSGLSKTFLSGKISRKVMNSFLCSTDRPFQFMGRINEDVNAYCSQGFTGMFFMTVAQLRLEQKQTQSNSGGLTDIYLDATTWAKSFYSVLYNPSSVKLRMMGQSHKRWHHAINWNNTVPKLIRG